MKNKDHNQTDNLPESSRGLSDVSKTETEKQPQRKSSMASRKSKTLKFAGPIKILVIETKGEYCRTLWCAVGVGLSHLMIGATNMAVFLYYMNSSDVHTLTCTLAYHFFSAEAILSLNYANGWSTPMRLRHRRFVHVFLQLCAMGCTILGTAFVIHDKGVSGTAHGITGIITVVFAALSLLTGPCALFGKSYFKIAHISFGMPTFLLSSISLCTAVLTQPFQSWADSVILYTLLSFIIFATIFVLTTPFIKCMIRF